MAAAVRWGLTISALWPMLCARRGIRSLETHALRIEFSYDPPTDPPVILHLDDRLIVVDKPAGLLSVPGKLEGRADCLITRLQAIYPDALVVHRHLCHPP